MAFNRSIADELARRVPAGVEAKTLHSASYSAIRRAFPKLGKVDEHKLDDHARDLVEKKFSGYSSSAHRTIILDLCRSYGLLKGTMTDLTNPEAVIETLAEYSIELEDANTASMLLGDLDKSMRDDQTRITFDEMLSFTVDHNVSMPKYSLLAVDECFVKETPVLLADGSSKMIGEIVDKQLSVKVLSYNEKTGKQESKKVINWKKVISKKPMVRITVQQIAKGRDGRALGLIRSRQFLGRRILVCTQDHRVFVQGKWVEAGKLKAGDVVQVEDSSPRDSSYNHQYKHGAVGKDNIRKSLATRQAIMPRPIGNPAGPIQRHGNGRGLTHPQQVLLDALGDGWEAEYSVPTGGRTADRPTCYKIDIANPLCKVAIEVDGPAHQSHKVQAKDRKKEVFLKKYGWRVYRFKNLDALRNAEEIAATMPVCPVDGQVIDVIPYEIDDSYVYDLTVEDNHNYYAHGILVHNCQDLNRLQITLVGRMMAAGARLFAVGDSRQSCYGFRGADSAAMDRIRGEFKVPKQNQLPLSITYRCPKAVVRFAQQFVPHIEASDSAPEGSVEHRPATDAAFTETLLALVPGDMAVCRANAPLVSCALKLIANHRRARIKGRDIGKAIGRLAKELLKKASDQTVLTLARVVEEYGRKQSEKLHAARKDRQADQIEDKCETLLAVIAGAQSLEEVQERLDTLFSDNHEAGAVMFSSIHRAKGHEAETVVWIGPEISGWIEKKCKTDSARTQELNLRYICITRAQKTLILQPMPAKSAAGGVE